ncbi:oxidoreductase [Streptomyces vilmorinianum]|uniref:oxidoreductase n=1 Tax=Streptomyces vilmorinianum TaxID=3051092 RepID=UPI0010FB424B|nr:oxidoreductase [Streptomyces vilmorinianum]
MTYPSGPYGYGYPPPPPPPQPGVIPLAPLGLSQILTGAFTTVGRYWKQLLGVAVIAYGGATLLVVAALGIAYAVVGDHLPGVFDLPRGAHPSWEDGRPLLIAFGCVWLVAMIGLLLASGVVYAASPAVVQVAVLGHPTTLRAVWRRSWSRMPAVLGTVFLTGLVLLIPTVVFLATFAGLIVAIGGGSPVTLVAMSVGGAMLAVLLTAPLPIWLWVKFSLAPTAAVIESQGPLAAMRRSSQLVRGSWWRIFGGTLMAGVIAAVINWALQQVFGALVSAPLSFTEGVEAKSATEILLLLAPFLVIAIIGSLIGQFVSSILPPLVTGLLYIDRRIRTEDLAPTLAQAAAEAPPFSR